MSKTKLACFCLALLLGLAVPEQAWAWGPGVHLYLGDCLLANLHLLPALPAQVISENRFSFLYGALSADMLVGKGRELTPDHCHSWHAGFRLLDTAGEKRLQAYAMGYLSHLAADVIAHNYYVPNMLQLQRRRGKVRHVSIEMKADRHVGTSFQDIRRIVQGSIKDADAQLLKILRTSKMTFSVKKMIFKGGVRLAGWNQLERQGIGLSRSQVTHKEYLQHMLDLSQQVIADCLNHTRDAEVASFDPMGFQNLGLVKKRSGKGVAHPRKREMAVFFVPAMCLLSL